MHLFRIEFQTCVMNCSFAYVMVSNLEINFLKILNQSEERNESRRRRKGGRQSEWSTNKHWKWSVPEAQWKVDICLLLIVCDGKYVLYFNNAWGVCCIIWRKLLEEVPGCFCADTFSVNNISSVAKYLLEVKALDKCYRFLWSKLCI